VAASTPAPDVRSSGPHPSPERDRAQALTVVSARRVERLLVRVRYVTVLLVVGMAVLFEPAVPPATLAVVALLVGANVLVHLRLGSIGTADQVRSLARTLVAVDVLAALATYGLFLGDTTAMPVALMAFLVFVLAVRFGPWGMGVGLAAFLAALLARTGVQRAAVGDAAVRLELILLWCAVALLLVAVAHELRAQERSWRSALEARERVARDLRETVSQTLSYAGIAPQAATHEDVLGAVEELVASSDVERATLIDRVATILSVPHHGLSPREQEILLLLARGDADARIARTLFISRSTVRNHLQNMRGKLQLASRDELQEFASRYAPTP
jgi:DNA-binding CsgD family transcriptional regulator/signal transduction histidine kinase